MHSKAVYLLIAVFLSISESSSDFREESIVETEYGRVKGVQRFPLGSSRPVFSYFGVQYGRSPEYVFRFRPAEDPWTWEGIRDATDENRPLCIQDDVRLQGLRTNTYLKYLIPENPTMSENCLVVDVFTPLSSNKTKETKKLLPVIAWIHGGSFQVFYSTTKLWALPAFEDVVLVQIQYRVGLFGFLTTDDAWAPPNSGLQDHIKALRWIKNNIRAFGGDPNSVTLMGESAGATAVTSHMLSPLTSGLFHRVFASSGAPNSMMWKERQVDDSNRIAKVVNCYFENTAYTSTCLRNKISSSRLLEVAKELEIIFTVQDSRDFTPAHPKNLIESKSFANSVPLMIGVTSGEVDYLLARRVFADIYYKGPNVTRVEMESVLREFILGRFPDGDVDMIMPAVIKEYLNPRKVGHDGISLLHGMLHAVADCWFVSKVTRLAEKLRETDNSVYFFEFAHQPSMYRAKPESFQRPYNRHRADHADDIPYLFGFPFVPELSGGNDPALPFTDTEKDLSRNLMRILANFATFGTPPPDMKWPQYPRYAIIDEKIKISPEPFHTDFMDLWNEIIPSLAHSS